MSWSAKRKLLHAELLGAHHEAVEAETDTDAAGGWDADEFDSRHDMQQAAQQAGIDTSDMPGAGRGGDPVPNSPQQGRRGDPTAHHDQSWDFSDDDTDWEFCPQCQGLYDPAEGEYEAHFDNPEFACQRGAGG